METITFGDIEAALTTELASSLQVGVGDELPDNRPSEYVTLKRSGGPRSNLVTDVPTIMFECWHETRAGASTLAHRARAAVVALTGRTIGGMTVYRVDEVAGPALLKHPIETQYRYVFTVALHVRYPR